MICAHEKTGLGSKDTLSNTGGRTYGIPSVRTDLPLPNPRRVSDKTNYGDSSSAWALLHPSIYTLSGVHEEHFNCPRSKAEVRTRRRAQRWTRTTGSDTGNNKHVSSWRFFFFTQYTSCSFSVSLKLDLFMQMSFCRAFIKLNIVHLWSPLTCLTDCWDLPKHRSEYFGGDVWGGLETRLHETPCRGGLCRELPHNSQRNKGAVTLPSVDCRTSTDHRDDWILRWWITAHTDLCYL